MRHPPEARTVHNVGMHNVTPRTRRTAARTCVLTTALMLLTASATAQPLTHLFKGGEEGYRCFRIPAIVATGKGTLLAFAEGRKNGCGDTGDIDLVVKRSSDGGETWSALKGDDTLIEPVCQGSLLWYDHKGRKPFLAFSNPASRESRTRMTVRISHDEGRTWPLTLVVHDGPAAYSNLVVLPGGNLAILFEAGEKTPYEGIAFRELSFGDFVK